jgi:hypothetical protein
MKTTSLEKPYIPVCLLAFAYRHEVQASEVPKKKGRIRPSASSRQTTIIVVMIKAQASYVLAAVTAS